MIRNEALEAKTWKTWLGAMKAIAKAGLTDTYEAYAEGAALIVARPKDWCPVCDADGECGRHKPNHSEDAELDAERIAKANERRAEAGLPPVGDATYISDELRGEAARGYIMRWRHGVERFISATVLNTGAVVIEWWGAHAGGIGRMSETVHPYDIRRWVETNYNDPEFLGKWCEWCGEHAAVNTYVFSVNAAEEPFALHGCPSCSARVETPNPYAKILARVPFEPAGAKA